MKPPKNFYSNLDRRKQGLPEVPEASAADVGKVIKVGEDGSYELGSDEGLPSVTTSDNSKMPQVVDGAWNLRPLTGQCVVQTSNTGSIVSTSNVGVNITKTSDSIVRAFLGVYLNHSALVSKCSSNNYTIQISDDGTIYKGFVSSTSSDTIIAIVFDSNNVPYIATITTNTITYSPYGNVRYFEITASGSSVSLPSGVTFDEVYALLQAGVDVKFTVGALVYNITYISPILIRAHWMSDLNLDNMSVNVINLGSDGTGTVASATFSGS